MINTLFIIAMNAFMGSGPPTQPDAYDASQDDMVLFQNGAWMVVADDVTGCLMASEVLDSTDNYNNIAFYYPDAYSPILSIGDADIPDLPLSVGTMIFFDITGNYDPIAIKGIVEYNMIDVDIDPSFNYMDQSLVVQWQEMGTSYLLDMDGFQESIEFSQTCMS